VTVNLSAKQLMALGRGVGYIQYASNAPHSGHLVFFNVVEKNSLRYKEQDPELIALVAASELTRPE